MSEKKVMKLASRSKRFGAGVIDAVIPFVAYLAFVCILAANGLKYSPYNDFGYGYGYGYGYDFGYNYGSRLSGGSAARPYWDFRWFRAQTASRSHSGG